MPCLALPAILWKVLEWIWYTFFSTRTANANPPAKDAANVEADDKKSLTANKVSEDKTEDEIAETNATETSTREPSPEKVSKAD